VLLRHSPATRYPEHVQDWWLGYPIGINLIPDFSGSESLQTSTVLCISTTGIPLPAMQKTGRSNNSGDPFKPSTHYSAPQPNGSPEHSLSGSRRAVRVAWPRTIGWRHVGSSGPSSKSSQKGPCQEGKDRQGSDGTDVDRKGIRADLQLH